ncbi:hypothetical protein BJV74DRAFT_766350 [Russula compacta]|nr:hypothetical protein BJV74DRAFT_766350 [Russula compacta]
MAPAAAIPSSDVTTATAGQGTEIDILSSELHHALQGLPSHPHHSDHQDSAPRRDDKQTSIEIIVNTDVLTLRGAGVEVTPALLSGQVVLDLAESTPLKQITLQFRGKAKMPPVENESVSFSNSPVTYIVCNHEWSFLEGEKKHRHTLKAGRHLFPFQLNLGGALPSSLYTSAYGGASVAYKLRAVATRPGFAHNLQAQKAITLLRSFAPEALEYQQSLEIENTWPEKIMYSIMVPHKAWAAGDDLTAIVKLCPLAKGGRILSVVTTLNETIRVHSRMGWQESTKPVITARHEFRNGQAVWVEHQDHRLRPGPSHHPQYSSLPCVQFLPTGNPVLSSDSPASHGPEGGSSTAAQSPPPNTEPGSESHSIQVDFELSDADIAAKLVVSLPLCTTPTHPLEPIITLHRIRWNIVIGNPDGHTSELRCSLPLHILDYRLLDEAKSATAQTRRLLLGGPEVSEDENRDLDLPSYPSHIRDRIANMYLPDQAVLRVANPWIHQGISPVQLDLDQDGRHSNLTSGADTPLEARFVSPPTGMGSGASDLEYVNSELLLSLSQNAPPPIETHRDREVASPPETASHSRSASRRASQMPSRVESRAPSPDRESSHLQSHSPPSTYVHASSTASRNLHTLFHPTMKPLTSLTSSFALPTRHYASPSPPHQRCTSSPHLRQQQQQQPGTATGSPPASAAGAGTMPVSMLPRTVPVTSHALLHRAFTEVPHYDIASRGFLGGITPLETLQGLPSYEEAEMQRSRSESDLASMAHRRAPATTATAPTTSAATPSLAP